MDKIISPTQGGFIKHQQILDDIILVQESIHSNKQAGNVGMAINLDMANALDSIKSSFVG